MGDRLIVTKDCENAKEWLELFSPMHPLWRDHQADWWFRGQSDSLWELSPKAMRPDTRWHWRLGGSGIGHIDGVAATSLREQLDFEEVAVVQFIDRCIGCGLAIPEDGQILRNPELSRRLDSSTAINDGIGFPHALHRSLYALAQHHGVATRLLDWTANPLVAAYFAVREVAEHEARAERARQRAKESEHKARFIETRDPTRPPANAPGRPAWRGDRCVVVALRTTVTFRMLGSESVAGTDPHLDAVSAPFADNPRLRAQDGRFSILLNRDKPQAFRQPSIEELIKKTYPEWQSDSPDGPLVVKLTLPHTECRAALRMLAYARMHAGYVYPEYDGIVRSLEEVGYFGTW